VNKPKDIGELNRRCTFQLPQEIEGDGGGSLTRPFDGRDWETAWCRFNQKSGSETRRAGRFEGQYFADILVRYNSKITSEMLVRLNNYMEDYRWKIVSIDPDIIGGNEYMLIEIETNDSWKV